MAMVNTATNESHTTDSDELVAADQVNKGGNDPLAMLPPIAPGLAAGEC